MTPEEKRLREVNAQLLKLAKRLQQKLPLMRDPDAVSNET